MKRLDQWTRRTDVPLTVAAVIFLAAYAIPIAWPALPRVDHRICLVVLAAAWIAFVADYGIRVWLAPKRRQFVQHHALDAATLALPMLRPLRLLRMVTQLPIVNPRGRQSLSRKVMVYATGGTGLLVLVSALAVTNAERGQPGATIENLGDGIWWAMTTISTVGYGDMSPVTAVGRVVAVALMIGGGVLLGIFTASLASWLVRRVTAESEAEQAATRAQVEALSREVKRLRHDLDLRLPIQNTARKPQRHPAGAARQ